MKPQGTKLKYLLYLTGCFAIVSLPFNLINNFNSLMPEIPEIQINQAPVAQIVNKILPDKDESLSKNSVIITAFGDLMLDRYVKNLIDKNGQDYIFKKFDKNVISNSDIIAANLEGPFTDKKLPPDKGEVDFAFNPELTELLISQNINLVGLANNHLLDQGTEGEQDCRDNLSKAGIQFFGDADSDEKEYILLESINEKRIAFFGLNLTDRKFDAGKIQQIFNIINKYSDYNFVFVHWGIEYTSDPNDKQKEIAHQLINFGADAIIGHHPHVVQTIEIYNDKPIFYSLGNFVFDQYFSKDTEQGLGIQIQILPYQLNYELLPIKLTKSQPEFMKEKEKQDFLNYLAEISEIENENINNQIKNGFLSF